MHIRRDFLDNEGRTHKDVWWETNGQRGLNGRKVETLPLYPHDMLEQAKTLTPRPRIIVCEGEKAAGALNAALQAAKRSDFLTVGTVTGASAVPCDDVLRDLAGFEVILWPDNDGVGRRHMQRVAARLATLGDQPSLYQWISWQDAPPKGDAADYFTNGGTVEGLEALFAPYVPQESIDAQYNAGASMRDEGVYGNYGSDTCNEQVGTLLADVKPEQLRPLWPGRLYLGKIADWSGDPGLGKSLVTSDIVARVTTGRAMPDGTPGVLGGAVLLSAEDDLADTIRPRLEAAGADLNRIWALDSVTETNPDTGEQCERGITIPADISLIERAIKQADARIVVIDPLMAFLGSKVDSHRDQDVRTALAPLARMAERHNVAVVMVRHLNKSAHANPLYRAGGSIGIIGAARTGLLIAKDPDDEELRILAATKSNLGPPMPALAYRIVATASGVPYVEWLGTSEHSAQALLAQPADEETRSMTDEAVEWLSAELAEGPRPANELQSMARNCDITAKAVRRARERLGIKPRREGFGQGSRILWALPQDSHIDAHRGHTCPLPNRGVYDDEGHLCEVTGGRHVYAKMRTVDGRRLCIECGEPEEEREEARNE